MAYADTRAKIESLRRAAEAGGAEQVRPVLGEKVGLKFG